MMLILPSGEVLSIEEARVFHAYGAAALQGTFKFASDTPRVDESGCSGCDDDDLDMEFSPAKPTTMTSVFEEARIPDQTNASPTISQFQPRSGRKAWVPGADSTPGLKTFKQVRRQWGEQEVG